VVIFHHNSARITRISTKFSVNKSLVSVGNYVTLRSRVEFKYEYRTQVGNLKLIAYIPDQCTFVGHSVMIGDSVFNGYTVQNNQLIVPLADASDIVHFCIIPNRAGDYAPNAYIEFTLNGKTIQQPIGAAYFQAEGLSIYVPNITAQKTITVKGIAPAGSLIKIYDNDIYAGSTTAFGTGNWAMSFDLQAPNGFSFHNIHGEVTTTQGSSLLTETKEVIYDETFNQIYKATMYNTDFYHRVNVSEFNFRDTNRGLKPC